MPLLDGLALAFAAARDYPALAIVLMTAYAEQRERVGEARMHDIIAKPFTLAEIRVAVADALAARDAS